MSAPANIQTPDKTAEDLGITRRTLDRWHARRIGPPRIKIGNKVWYRREAVSEWLQLNETGGQ